MTIQELNKVRALVHAASGLAAEVEGSRSEFYMTVADTISVENVREAIDALLPCLVKEGDKR